MTGPAIGHYDEAAATLPPLHRVLTPDEFRQAQQMTPQALASRPFPIVPPAAPKESTRVGAPPNPDATQQTGLVKVGTDAFAMGAGMLEHPESILGMVTAPVIALYHGFERQAEIQTAAAQAMQGVPGPLAVDKSPAAQTAEAKQSAADLAQIGALALAGPVEGKIAEALTPVIGAQAAGHVAKIAAGAGVGAAYNPDHLAAGAVFGGVLGAATAHATAESDAVGVPQLPEPQRAIVQQKIADLHDAWQVIFDPAGRTDEAGAAANILRSTTGHAAAAYEQAAFKLDDFRRMVEPLPDAEKLAFIDAVEGGKGQATPELQQGADLIRQTLDQGRQAVQDLGTGKLDQWIEDYFPHIWQDPDKAKTVFEQARTADLAKPPELDAVNSALDVLTAQRNALTDPSLQRELDFRISTLETQREKLMPPPLNPDGTPITDPEALRQARARTGGKRPMEGSKSFLKQRTIPTTAEGIAKGLVPVSLNPVDLTLLKLREMQRYVMAHQSLGAMKEAGLVNFVRDGERAPDGYQQINDKVATVFGPREGAVALPDEANISPDQVHVFGTRTMGRYYAPEPVAKIVNNYLSPGLRGNALYDAYRGIGNALNQAQLGFSAFHLGFTSMDASVSRVALGVEYLTQGHALDAVKEFVSAPVAPVTNAMKGYQIRKAYLDPTNASPDMQALANAVQEAGGRVKQDSFYQNSAADRMVRAWRANQPVKAGALSIPALLETVTKPLLEHIVPMQKLGVFGDLAQKALADLPPDANLATRRQALASAWDSVDNRMGQLVYDNLFWNKAFKDLAMASVRSVGWNIGTIRELGGGLSDAGTAVQRLATGQKAEMTHKAAYVAALPITVGMYGAMYQYLRTGEGPQELKDYFFPRTGEVDADGNPERVQLPSYMKDVLSYSDSPWQTLKHKVNPMPELIVQMLDNQDYFGDAIRNPMDPVTTQAQQEAAFIAHNVLPFSVQGMLEENARGDQSKITKMGNWFGVTPAPRSRVRSDAENRMADFAAQDRSLGTPPETVDARQARANILAGLRGNANVDLETEIGNAFNAGYLSPKQLGQVAKKAGLTPDQVRFQGLTAVQALDVFQRATDPEKAKFARLLVKKLGTLGTR